MATPAGIVDALASAHEAPHADPLHREKAFKYWDHEISGLGFAMA